MAEIIIYSSNACPYCIRAKKLLDAKGVSYQEINVDEKPQFAAEAVSKSGGCRTVPQIFIDNQHIGGYDDLSRMDRENKLDKLLG